MVLEAPIVAADVVQWLYSDASYLNDTLEIVSEMAARLRDGNVPVDRATTGIWVVHPNVRAEASVWASDGTKELRLYTADNSSDEDYQSSPIQRVHQTNQAVRVRISERPEEAEEFPVAIDLRDEGYTDYIALPMPFSDGSVKVASFATKAPGGFRSGHISVFESLIRPLALVCELKTLRRTAETVLDTYVGPRAGSKVLDGTTRRGQGEWIKAVVSFADIRGFTRLSNTLPADMIVNFLNKYFGAMTAAVEAHGGEVLKFIGDEVMAIFPYETEEEARDAARRALLAARDTLGRIDEINRSNKCAQTPDLSVGIALHAGDVFYGNVGSETRLDFTVVGPVVNLAARIAELAKDLHREVLVSDALSDIMGCRSGLFGRYQVKGFDDPVSVYSPDLLRGDKLGYCPDNTATLARDTN
ncbi:adenylate/guanylate cyclase domain-containing protein [Roseibium album]|uniref:Adenylate cyclase 1 n=1 Tax=Roseibium album TaxID=311410 RepID=A0A0M6ZNA4_9HYPH|nr:adenylate/guanylate cyclase domain-containing protein [Roseibium album]MBG6211080.1 adenylate cyclase [Labrenzia sp. EL_126]CTQ58875.1 Adenylate cyclase 1 [Roseibium album]CTQ63600.1 Adenylate cyclase 1 [Roseibium album]CTQ73138.1 Adenylate cyclase 1 [Roseibium album]